MKRFITIATLLLFSVGMYATIQTDPIEELKTEQVSYSDDLNVSIVTLVAMNVDNRANVKPIFSSYKDNIKTTILIEFLPSKPIEIRIKSNDKNIVDQLQRNQIRLLLKSDGRVLQFIPDYQVKKQLPSNILKTSNMNFKNIYSNSNYHKNRFYSKII